MGTGFMMISRKALLRIRDAYPQLVARIGDLGASSRDGTMFFDCMIDPETNEYLSEDYAFCKRWRDGGGEIWADVTTSFTHIGHASYSGSLMNAMART